jgi:hypothetical protein
MMDIPVSAIRLPYGHTIQGKLIVCSCMTYFVDSYVSELLSTTSASYPSN